LEDHLVLGVIDEIYQLPESQGEHGPMDIFVSVARKKKFGISDVKTRVNSSLPRDRNSRAAEMQLSVYYRLLAVMVDGTVDMKRLYSELGLDSQVCFSDAFLVEAGTTYSDIGVLGFDVLLENNCLDVWLQVCLSKLISETMEFGIGWIKGVKGVSRKENAYCMSFYFTLLISGISASRYESGNRVEII